jgi:hypothetical protein
VRKEDCASSGVLENWEGKINAEPKTASAGESADFS